MRLSLTRPQASATVPPSVPSDVPGGDPPGAVRFRTEVARQRFVPIEPMGDVVSLVAPRTRVRPGTAGQDTAQLVARGALPGSVTCGRGYIEVVAFVDGGIVVNEVRTHGDQVVAMAWLELPPDLR